MKITLRKTILLITSLLSLSTIVQAEQIEYQSVSYKEAGKSSSYVRFDMSSTKVGILTTSFTGFVKKFSLNGEVNKNEISEASLEFLVQDLDTDIDGRNDKMWNYCLNSKEHPKIKIALLKTIEVDSDVKEVPATILVRGLQKEIFLYVKAERLTNGDLVLDLSGNLSLKFLEIPDPSIVVASVKDAIKVKAHFLIKNK